MGTDQPGEGAISTFLGEAKEKQDFIYMAGVDGSTMGGADKASKGRIGPEDDRWAERSGRGSRDPGATGVWGPTYPKAGGFLINNSLFVTKSRN